MIETIVLGLKALMQAADYLAGLERTESEIEYRCGTLAGRARRLVTILTSYSSAARHHAAIAAALDGFDVALHDALRLVESCRQSSVMGGLIPLPYSMKKNLAKLVQAEETIKKCIKDLELAVGAPDHRPQSANIQVTQTFNNLIVNYGNINMVPQLHQPRGGGGGGGGAFVPSPQPRLSSAVVMAITGQAVIRQRQRTYREPRGPPQRDLVDDRLPHRSDMVPQLHQPRGGGGGGGGGRGASSSAVPSPQARLPPAVVATIVAADVNRQRQRTHREPRSHPQGDMVPQLHQPRGGGGGASSSAVPSPQPRLPPAVVATIVAADVNRQRQRTHREPRGHPQTGAGRR